MMWGTTKPRNITVHPAKVQISLCILSGIELKKLLQAALLSVKLILLVFIVLFLPAAFLTCKALRS